MVRCKWKGSAFGDIGALFNGWLKEAKAPLPLRNQSLIGSQASQSNQAIKSFALLTRTLRSVAAPRRLLQRYIANQNSFKERGKRKTWS